MATDRVGCAATPLPRRRHGAPHVGNAGAHSRLRAGGRGGARRRGRRRPCRSPRARACSCASFATAPSDGSSRCRGASASRTTPTSSRAGKGRRSDTAAAGPPLGPATPRLRRKDKDRTSDPAKKTAKRSPNSQPSRTATTNSHDAKRVSGLRRFRSAHLDSVSASTRALLTVRAADHPAAAAVLHPACCALRQAAAKSPDRCSRPAWWSGSRSCGSTNTWPPATRQATRFQGSNCPSTIVYETTCQLSVVEQEQLSRNPVSVNYGELRHARHVRNAFGGWRWSGTQMGQHSGPAPF